MRSGGKILADTLLGHGVDLVFCVPGESYLALLDALYDSRSTAPHRVPARRRRGKYGGSVRQAHRPPGNLLGHARSGRDATPASAFTRRIRIRRR